MIMSLFIIIENPHKLQTCPPARSTLQSQTHTQSKPPRENPGSPVMDHASGISLEKRVTTFRTLIVMKRCILIDDDEIECFD
jgi:hypothetical protein